MLRYICMGIDPPQMGLKMTPDLPNTNFLQVPTNKIQVFTSLVAMKFPVLRNDNLKPTHETLKVLYRLYSIIMVAM